MSAAKKILVAVAGVLAVGAPVFVGMAGAQTQPDIKAVLKFEVASVKPSDPDSRGMRITRSPGNGLITTGSSLKTLIRLAYNVEDFQITGAPGWISTERYDIVAKPDRAEGPDDLKDAPEPQKRHLFDVLRERTRSLLAERFHLEVHLKTEERPIYLLVQAKGGHKMRVSQQEEGVTRNRGKIRGDGERMGQFAGVLGMVLGRPVLDRTGLADKFDFTLEFTEDSPAGKGGPEGEPVPADPDGASIFTAIQSQLGLKLESGRGPVPVIVIDRVERPTAN